MLNIEEVMSQCPLGFGGAAISGEGGGYGFGKISEKSALDLLNEAKDLGVQLFDTAPIYGFGLSEERMGKAFKSDRESAFIVSKSGITWSSTKRVDMTNDPQVTQKMLEESLKRLQSDYIDLFMIHWPDQKVDIRFPYEVLLKAKEKGMIRYVGLCNTNPEDLAKAREVGNVDAIQCELNPFNRDVVEDIFPSLEDQTPFMSWGSLDKGILTKKVDRKRELSKSYDDEDCRRSAPWWKQSDVIKKVEALESVWPLIEESGHSPLEWAMGHNLSFSPVKCVLMGAKNSEQLNQVHKSLNNLPNAELIKKWQETLENAYC
jgi:myo-inositol catabolism protein IolS